MKLYSKENATNLISSMLQGGRLARSLLLLGEKGVGKRTLAHYIAMQILCEEQSGTPCGVCKSCKMLSHDAHPDVITVTPSGKSDNYVVKDLRPIVAESGVSANEGGFKIYIIPNIDKAQVAAQNILLKIFEEPPEHIVFIMTADSYENVLPTILSRAVQISVPVPSVEGCIEALTCKCIPLDEAEKATSIFGGNIGACLCYIEGDNKEIYQRFSRVAKALADLNEFELAKEFFISDRADALEIIAKLVDFLGLACKVKEHATLSGSEFCYKEAEILSSKVTLTRLYKMYKSANSSYLKILGSASVSLTMSNLCAELNTAK